MQYRSREKIVYQYLQALTGDKTKLQTHIMYDVRLSYAQLKEYTSYLETNGLIKRIDSAVAITDKGRELVRSLEKVFSQKLTLS